MTNSREIRPNHGNPLSAIPYWRRTRTHIGGIMRDDDDDDNDGDWSMVCLGNGMCFEDMVIWYWL